MSASVIASMDAAPVLEPTEHDFDFVALLVERAVIVDLGFPIGLGRDTGVAFTTDIIATTGSKAEARAFETWLIQDYRRQHGVRPPGNLNDH